MASSQAGRNKSAPGVVGARGAKSSTSAGSTTQVTSKPKKPSDILNPKTIDPFSNTKNQSAFASIYSTGGIPCRLSHGSVKHKLTWSTPPEQVSFDPVLVTLAEGLHETVHPYTFVARTGFKELLETQDSASRTVPLLPKITVSIRGALAHRDDSVFVAGLEALVQLSNVVGPALNPHLNKMLVPVSKHMMDKKHRERIIEILHQLEQNGGRDTLPIIKSKIPTYSSIFG